MMELRKSLTLLIVALVLVAPACRSKSRKKTEPTVMPSTTVTDTAVPDIPPVAIGTEEEPDFVSSELDVRGEDLPADVAQLNLRAQDLGWIRDVFFEYDSSNLSPDAQDALAVTASWLKQHPDYTLLIEGHCDERGTEQYNLALGDRRANIAREYLATLGVNDAKLRTVSYGEERPFVKGSMDGAWRQNRRAHLVLVRP
jgi:peptidoglycan-associated lipoprotein